jgi:hypothetical protein
MNCSYLASNSMYSDARECSYLAADQLGYSDDIEQIRNAWIAVGLDFPSYVDIDGEFALCGATDYSVINLPSGYSVSWQLDGTDAQNFSISTSGNQCTVTPSVINANKKAVLHANILYHGFIVKTITKKIYTHSTYLYVAGFQNEYYDGTTYYPSQTFNFICPSTTSGYSSNQKLINTECDIQLTSTRFKGMDISFEGNILPTIVTHNDSCVTFHTEPFALVPLSQPGRSINDLGPILPIQYNLAMVVSSEEGCRDFTLNFVVSNIDDHNPELIVSVSGNTLSASLTVATPVPIGGGQYQQPTWNLYVINPQTGLTVISKSVTGMSTTVNISSLSSGLYIVRAVYNGNTYSSKFLK